MTSLAYAQKWEQAEPSSGASQCPNALLCRQAFYNSSQEMP